VSGACAGVGRAISGGTNVTCGVDHQRESRAQLEERHPAIQWTAMPAWTMPAHGLPQSVARSAGRRVHSADRRGARNQRSPVRETQRARRVLHRARQRFLK
jgi:hypothetical protein